MPSVARIHSLRTYRGNNATSTSWTHVVPSMGNGMLLCEVFARNNGTVTPPTYGGTPLTLVPGSEVSAGTGTSRRYVAWFYMLAPTAGSASLDLAVGAADSGNYGLKVFNCYNVDQSTPFRSQGGGNFALVDSGTAVTSTSLAPASSVGDLVLSALYSASAPTWGSGQYKEAAAGVNARAWTMSKEAEATSTTLSATSPSNTVVHSAISIIGDATTQPAPADYTGSRGKKSWIVSGLAAGEAYGSGATQYFALAPSVEASSGSPNATVLRTAGTFSDPGCIISANAATAAGTLTLWVNNASTGMTVTVPAGSTGYFSGSGTVSVSAGDNAGWRFTGGTGGSTTLTQAMVVFEASSAETVSFLGALSSSAGKLAPGETRFVNVHGSRASTSGNTDERKAALPIQTNGTWAGLRTEKVGTTTDGTVTAESRVNAATGAQAISWSSGGTSSEEDTTNTEAVVVGDELAIKFVSGGSVGNFEYERVSSRLVTTSGEFVVQAAAAGGAGQSIGAAGTQYVVLGGELGYSSTESAAQIVLPFDAALMRLWVRLGENVSVATGDSTAVLRINSVDTALTVQFNSIGEHYTVVDLENVVNGDAGDLVSIAVTHGTGGTSNTLRLRAVGFVGVERVAAATTHATSGSLAAQASSLAGAALHPHTSSGALAAQAATVAGNAVHPHLASGTIAAQASGVTGAAAHQHAGAGVLASDAAGVSGVADRSSAGAFDASGSLSAQAAMVIGAAQRIAAHATAGSLASGPASIAGAAAHLALHTSEGALAAGPATFAGVAVHSSGGGATDPAAVWAFVLSNGKTAEQTLLENNEMLRVILAGISGTTSGIGTSTETYYGTDGTTPRIVATFDAQGNRTSVAIDGAP